MISKLLFDTVKYIHSKYESHRVIIAENETGGIDIYQNDKIIRIFSKQTLTDQIISTITPHLDHENEPISVERGFEDNYYLLHGIFREYLIDFFLCVFYGYYSEDDESYLKSLLIVFDLFVSLHSVFYDLIRYSWHHPTFTAPPINSCDITEYFFSIYEPTIKIENDIIRINTDEDTEGLIFEKIKEFNNRNYILIFNHNQEEKDSIFDKIWYKRHLNRIRGHSTDFPRGNYEIFL